MAGPSGLIDSADETIGQVTGIALLESPNPSEGGLVEFGSGLGRVALVGNFAACAHGLEGDAKQSLGQSLKKKS